MLGSLNFSLPIRLGISKGTKSACSVQASHGMSSPRTDANVPEYSCADICLQTIVCLFFCFHLGTGTLATKMATPLNHFKHHQTSCKPDSSTKLPRRRSNAPPGLSNTKSICIMLVVVACFAVLWPNIFYPMWMKGLSWSRRAVLGHDGYQKGWFRSMFCSNSFSFFS